MTSRKKISTIVSQQKFIAINKRFSVVRTAVLNLEANGTNGGRGTSPFMNQGSSARNAD
jgi:hypothetical protein